MPARLLCLAAIAALAGMPAYALDTLESPSGEVRISGEQGAKTLHVGGTAIPLGASVAYADLHTKIGNLILVSTSAGGNACPATFRWLDTTRGKVSMTEPFGTCSDMIEVSHTAEVVTVTMPSFDASKGTIAYDFDGKTVSERMLGLESAGVSGDDPKAWAGKGAYDYLGAAENEARLIELMGWDKLDMARNSIVVTSEVLEEQDGYLVAGGCKPHDCGATYGAIAIDLETGEPLVALKQDGAKAELFGKPRSALPNRIRQVMTGR